MAFAEVKVDDISLASPKDSLVVRLFNEDALEIYGDGEIYVYTNEGADFSHKIDYKPAPTD